VRHPTSTVSTVGRKVDLDDLVDATEIARRLNVKRPQVVHDWRRRHEDFPEPVAFLGNAHVWLWPDVEKWARSTGRSD
jgi:predicted DNA-binding transcriptional regulator AlpA